MFSRRTAWDRSPNELARLVTARTAEGSELLDLTVSDPFAAGLGWDEGRLADLLSLAGLAEHRPEPLGLLSAREAVAHWSCARGLPLRPDRLVLTASTSEAYSFLFKLLCDAGDAVAVPRPSYPLFGFLTELDGVEAQVHPLRLEADRWAFDVETLADRLTERTRAVLVVHPNNPTGSRLDAVEAGALAALCAERGLALVSDEVFSDFTWSEGDEHEPKSLLSVAGEAGVLTFALSGLSKSAGLPQLKLAWIAVGGPEPAVEEAMARLEWIADSYLSVAAPVQRAAAGLLEASGEFRARCLDRIRTNLGLLERLLAETGGRLQPGEAGWSAILELPAGADEEVIARELVRREGVWVHPGSFFDLPAGNVVVSLLTPTERLDRGARALLGRCR